MKKENMYKYLDSKMDHLVNTVKNQPWDNKEFYKEYLAQSYFYTFHSCKMLAMAASLTTAEQSEYYKRSIQHIKEEFGHDSLALSDLKKMNGNIEEYPELGATRALWEPQFYKIQRQTTSLLGYILALEYMCVRIYREIFERVSKAHGDKNGNFIRIHAEDDPDHVEKCVDQIELLPESERVAVWKNYEQTCMMFAVFLQQCAFKAELRSRGFDKSNQGAPRVA